jgi:hypothetical protein
MKLALFMLTLAILISGCNPAKPLYIGGGSGNHIPPEIQSREAPVKLRLDLSVWGEGPRKPTRERWKDVRCMYRYTEDEPFISREMRLVEEQGDTVSFEVVLPPLSRRPFIEYYFTDKFDGHEGATNKHRISAPQ